MYFEIFVLTFPCRLLQNLDDLASGVYVVEGKDFISVSRDITLSAAVHSAKSRRQMTNKQKIYLSIFCLKIPFYLTNK